METVFTRIVSGEIPGVIIYEDQDIFAFMDAGQLNPGHVLVAPKKAYATILDMDEDMAANLMRVAHKVAKAVQKAYEPEGFTLLQANGVAGWQTVPHAHIHVLPRYSDDGVGLIWPRKDPGLEKLREYAKKINIS